MAEPQQDDALTEAAQRSILRDLRRGAGRAMAARRAGLDPQQLAAMLRGDRSFGRAVARAEAIKAEAVADAAFRKAIREQDVPAARLFLDHAAKLAATAQASKALREARRAAAEGLPASIGPLVDDAVRRVISLSMQFVPPERMNEFADAIAGEFGAGSQPGAEPA